MPEPDVIYAYYRLVDAGDITAMVSLFSVDAEYRRPGYPTLRGRDDIASFYKGTRVIDSGRHRVDEVVVDGGRVAVRGNFTGTVKGGARVELRFADFFHLDAQGRFQTRETFFFVPLV